MGIVLHGILYAAIIVCDLPREIWENNVLCWNRHGDTSPCYAVMQCNPQRLNNEHDRCIIERNVKRCKRTMHATILHPKHL